MINMIEEQAGRYKIRISVMLSESMVRDLDLIAIGEDDYRGRLIRMYVKKGIEDYFYKKGKISDRRDKNKTKNKKKA